jgi:hypothetical protein
VFGEDESDRNLQIRSITQPMYLNGHQGYSCSTHGTCSAACRRVLKKFADTEYPSSTGTTLNGHPLADDKSKNRILEWVKETTKGTSQAGLVSAHIDLLSKYLDSLYSLASKGDKNPITRYEAELCSIHTYFMMAELIRIKLSSMSPNSGTR